MILLFQPAPFSLPLRSFPLPPFPKENQPTWLPQNLSSTSECHALSESRLALENSFREKQEADLSSADRAGMGRSGKELSWGAKHRQSWLPLVTHWQFHLIAQISEQRKHSSCHTVSFFYKSLSIRSTLITQGKVRPYSLARAQLQGNDARSPPPTSPCSANPPLLWPIKSLPLPGPLLWGSRPQALLSVSYCVAESIW